MIEWNLRYTIFQVNIMQVVQDSQTIEMIELGEQTMHQGGVKQLNK